MKKKSKLKYYLVEWEEVDYNQQYVEAPSKEEAIEQIYEISSGNVQNVTADEVSKDKFEENQ